MRVRSLAIPVVSCLISALIPHPVRAQERGGVAPAARQNLQVLAKDIPQPELLQVMQGFAQGLGVQCTYCHAPAPPPEGGRAGGGGA
jgi:hypothetical protein